MYSVIFDNIKLQTIEYVFELVINDTIDPDLLTILEVAKVDALSKNNSLRTVYNDIVDLEESFLNIDYTLEDMKNPYVINNINSELKQVVNSNSFSYLTSNVVYKILLENINKQVQDIDTANLDSTKLQLVNEFKANINTYITNEINNIENIRYLIKFIENKLENISCSVMSFIATL